MRTFESGATRDVDLDKLDYEAFLAPSVLQAYAEYMHGKRYQTDGSLRDGDNWQKGIPKDVYMKSAWRHFFAVWQEHRGIPTKDGMKENLLALLFNVMGYIFEYLKSQEQLEVATHRYGALAEHAEEVIKEEFSDYWNDPASWQIIAPNPFFRFSDEFVPRSTPLTASEIEASIEKANATVARLAPVERSAVLDIPTLRPSG